jgi:hypothetical protein
LEVTILNTAIFVFSSLLLTNPPVVSTGAGCNGCGSPAPIAIAAPAHAVSHGACGCEDPCARPGLFSKLRARLECRGGLFNNAFTGLGACSCDPCNTCDPCASSRPGLFSRLFGRHHAHACNCAPACDPCGAPAHAAPATPAQPAHPHDANKMPTDPKAQPMPTDPKLPPVEPKAEPKAQTFGLPGQNAIISPTPVITPVQASRNDPF